MFNLESRLLGICDISYLDAFENVLKLRTDEGAAPVGCVDVQPQTLFFADQSQLLEIVERTQTRRPQCSTHLQRNTACCQAELLTYLLID